uniref:Uncharacterized protein n=1 Tax=Bellilinea caldifistulae TaxID=360411 RepID=A0A7C4L222_9CHLR
MPLPLPSSRLPVAAAEIAIRPIQMFVSRHRRRIWIVRTFPSAVSGSYPPIRTASTAITMA